MDEAQVVVGAGPIGSAVALQLAEQWVSVRLLTRSGSGPDHPRITRQAVDANDADALIAATADAAVIYNCVNPPYHRWPTDWPPIAANLLAAAHHSGAVLATASNLYGYGPVSQDMTEDLPLAATGSKGKVRAQMWQDALAAHQAGTVIAVEVRGSDYVGAGAQSHLGERAIPPILAGKTVRVLGNPDQLHTFTYTQDMARTLIAAASDSQAWGRAWHAPSNPPRTQREALADVARVAGVAPPKVKSLSPALLKVAGLFNPTIRELAEVQYQFTNRFVMDSGAAQEQFDLAPTPWDQVLADAVRSFGGTPVV